MKVFLTGAAGFVGRAAVDVLSAEHEVTAFDIRPVENYAHAIQGDVLDYKAVEAAMAGHDAVVNALIATTGYGVDGSGFDINVRGMFNLLEATCACEIPRFIHTSSGAVHTGYPEDTCLTHDLYPLKASSVYALSKVAQEEIARYYHEQHGLSIACIRPWSIIDADRMVRATGRSYCGPALRRSAGARLATMRRAGRAKAWLTRPDRTRSRASWTAASGSPITLNPGSPGRRSTSTSTVAVSRPRSAGLTMRATMRPAWTARARGWRADRHEVRAPPSHHQDAASYRADTASQFTTFHQASRYTGRLFWYSR